LPLRRCVPTVLNEEPAHTNSFILFCNGVESGFMAPAYESSSLTRNSQARPCADGPGHNDSSSSSPLGVAGPGRPGVTPSYYGTHFDRPTVQLQPVNRGAVTSRRHCPGQSKQIQNVKYPGLNVTWSQDQEFQVRARGFQVTRKARWALRGPRRISDTSRRHQVTRPIRAETSVYSFDQGEK
jgi:hypothetical protein